MCMTIRALPKYAAAIALAAAAFAVGTLTTSAAASTPDRPQVPHCGSEDGGPQPVCIWDSAVDGNGTPAAPNNTVILYISRPGQDSEAIRLKG